MSGEGEGKGGDQRGSLSRSDYLLEKNYVFVAYDYFVILLSIDAK